jgi:cytochrome c5
MAMSALVAVVLLIALVYGVTAARFQVLDAKSQSQEAVAARVAPVGKLTLTGEAVVAAAPASTATDPGEAVYKKVCTACHATGAAGAPLLGDKAAWEPRVGQGLDGLLAVAIAGKGAMPPRGSCPNCSDEDLRVAIVYMLAQVGHAPAAAAAPAAAPAAPVAEMAGMSGMEGMSSMSGMEGMSAISGMSGSLEGMSGREGVPTAPVPSALAIPGSWVPPGWSAAPAN